MRLYGKILCLIAAALLPAGGVAGSRSLTAANIVMVTPHLVTSGQPTAASLADLHRHGF